MSSTALDHLRPPEIVDAATRREFLAMLGAAGLLAACGDGGEAPAGEPAAGTRTFVDDAGRSVEVPAEPRRIVALNDGNGGAQILDLGLPLAGLTTRVGEFSTDFLGVEQPAVADVAPVGEPFELNLEAIAALRPDLIGYLFGDGEIPHENLDALEAIAPTALIATFDPVIDVIRRFSELLGVDDSTLTDRVAMIEERISAIRSGMAVLPAGVTVTSAYHFGEDEVRVNGSDVTTLDQVLASIGTARSPITPDSGQEFIGYEQLSLIDADLILYYFQDPLPEGPQELFDQLAAVRAGQAHEYEMPFVRTLTGMERALDFLEPILTHPALDTEVAP